MSKLYLRLRVKSASGGEVFIGPTRQDIHSLKSWRGSNTFAGGGYPGAAPSTKEAKQQTAADELMLHIDASIAVLLIPPNDTNRYG